MASPPDKVLEGAETHDLHGHTFEYGYGTGQPYRISFSDNKTGKPIDSGMSSYESIAHFTPSTPETAPNGAKLYYISLPARVKKMRDGQYLAHWMVPGRKGHIVVFYDLEERTVFGSALMPGGYELWDSAKLETWKTNGEGALYLQPPTRETGPW